MVNRGANKRMVLRHNKKGMFFTILVISLLSLFIMSYSFYFVSQDREATNKRVKTMNNFVFSIEKDLPRQVYISGFRMIFLLERKITETGNYIADLNNSVEELFFNGTINNESQELMNGAKLVDIKNSLNEKAQKINANVTISNSSIIVSQENPWEVKFVLKSNLFIADRSNLVMWNKTLIIIANIPIENFEDPLYIISTNGLVTNKINKTSYTNFTQGVDVTNLLAHVKSQNYIASALAPSFLDRLQGKLSANPNGIESLVYLPKLSAQGIAVNDKSVVDYIYFSNNNPAVHNIQGMQPWFKIDDAHLNVYQVGGLII